MTEGPLDPGRSQKYKRKKIPLVEKTAQVYLSLTIILYLVVYTIVMLVAILLPSVLNMSVQDAPMQQQFQGGSEFLFIDKRIVPVILVIMFGMGIHFVFITHRIFGPFARFKRVLHEWSQGKWPAAFHPRKKDFNQELFALFSTVLGNVGDNIHKSRKLIEEAVAEIENQDAGEAEAPSPNEKALQKCREALELTARYFPEDTGERG